MARPFTTFNFKVLIEVGGEAGPVCDAEFAECDGLEMTHEIKTFREGGDNGRQVHLAGPVSYGLLTLKRGMTADFGLWRWFERVQQDRGLRGDGEVVMLASGRRREEQVRFVISGCLPAKLKAPALNAQDGVIAIEEMQIAYERLQLRAPGII